MFKPIKKLGQNFLKDKHAILEMIQALEMKDGETLVEIGPGLGVDGLVLEEGRPSDAYVWTRHYHSIDVAA